MNTAENAGRGATVDPLKVELRPVSALRPCERNARTHSDRQIEQIASSIRQFGFNNPVLIDDNDGIIAGHGRVAAATRLGLTEVPTVRLSHLSREERIAYAIADNRIAENAGWDEDNLRVQLQELLEVGVDLEIELTGFSTGEIEVILGSDDSKEAKEDALPSVDRRLASGVEIGDLWQLGRHKLYCGSSLERSSFDRLMGDQRARMVFSDPPYNVKIKGHVGGLGNIQHDEFQMAAGEMDRAGFTRFLREVFTLQEAFSINGALHYQCMDWRHIGEMLEAGHAVYSDLKNVCVWVKENGGMGSLYRSQHEMVFVWKVGSDPHLNTVELGRHGRYRTNVWKYNGPSRTGASADLAMHPTVKPAAMIMDAIKDTSKRGDIVLDAFGGSGSTLIAAERTGRCARLVELEPKYCATTIRRWQEMSGKEAILTSTGETFAAVHARRHAKVEQTCDAALDEPAFGEVA